jgi:hypothetical protein
VQGERSDDHFRLADAGRLLASEGRFGSALLLGLKTFLDSAAEAAAEVKLILVGTRDRETEKLICEMSLIFPMLSQCLPSVPELVRPRIWQVVANSFVSIMTPTRAVRDAIAALYADFKSGALSLRNPSYQLQAELRGHTVADHFLATCRALISSRSEGRAVRLERLKQQEPLTEKFF